MRPNEKIPLRNKSEGRKVVYTTQDIMAHALQLSFALPMMLALGTTATTNKRKRRTTVSDACTSCRRSKVKCDEERPCLRCIKHDWQDSCVSWSEVKAARAQDSGDKNVQQPSFDPVATADKAKPDASRENAKQMPSAQHDPGRERNQTDLYVDLLQDARQEYERQEFDSASCTTLSEAATDWSHDEDDDFFKAMEFLKAFPVPRDHPLAQDTAKLHV